MRKSHPLLPRFLVVLVLALLLSAVTATASAISLSPGVYRVGVDIPAGDYTAYSRGGRFAAVWEYRDYSNGKLSHSLFNVSFSGSESAKVTLTSGTYLEINFQTVTFDTYRPTNSFSRYGANTIKKGVYKVGQEIPAGDYFVHSSNGRFASVWVYSNYANGKLSNSLQNESMEGSEKVKVSLYSGNYVEVNFEALVFEPYTSISSTFRSGRSTTVPKGIYQVGTEIPSGTYYVSSSNGKFATIWVYNSYYNGKLSRSVMHKTFEGNTRERVTLTYGTYVDVCFEPLVFSAY